MPVTPIDRRSFILAPAAALLGLVPSHPPAAALPPPPPPSPSPSSTPVAVPAPVARDRPRDARLDEFTAACQNEDALHDARVVPLPFTVTEGEFVQYSEYRRGLTLDEVIERETEEWADDPDLWDRAVWHGRRLVALIQVREDGSAAVIRF